MTSHPLALPDLARILVGTGRTVRTVRDGHAVGGAKTTEVVALHGTGKALTDRGAGHVDQLAGDEVAGRDLGADVDQVVCGNAELDELRLRLDVGSGKVAAHRLRRVLDLGLAGAELNGGVAVLVLGALGHDLAVLQPQILLPGHARRRRCRRGSFPLSVQSHLNALVHSSSEELAQSCRVARTSRRSCRTGS